jgi:hypothetical protein
MTGIRSLALAATTLGAAALGVANGAQACGDWGGNSRSSYSSGPTVYGYYSGDSGRRGYRSGYRSNLGGPVIRISSGRNYTRSGWRR